jgi:RND family efflux transporter MFP subunit
MTRIHIAVASTALFSIALSVGCSAEHAAVPAPSAIPVKVKPVTRTADVALLRYSGSIEPAARVDMAFRVGGYVEVLGQVKGSDGKPRNFEEGDFIKRGTVLAKIRAADYSQKVATARAGISQAQAEAEFADAELKRAERLFETKALSKADLDAKRAHADSARANVAAATAQAGEASVALADTVLKAPMDGVILSRDLEVGTLIAPGRTVIALADISRVKANFAVPETLVEKLSVGSPLSVHVGADRESSATQRTLSARVTRIAPAADAKGRVFSVEAELPNADGALKPGSVVSVRVPGAALDQRSLSVPLSAVVRSPTDARGFSVFVLDGQAPRGRARLHDVKLGEVLGNSITVEAGLELGQRVVTMGATLIQDGSDTVVIP